MMTKRKREETAEGADGPDDIATEIREISPADYVFKIKSFSLFRKNDITMHETNEFEVGDQKWTLILYPNGDESEKGKDHVSLYLVVSEANPLKVGWEIYANVRFFVLDQIRDEYLVKEVKNRRFHTMKSKWGIPNFMPLKTLTNPSNGYLVDDTCILGVEVYVIKSLEVGECLTLKESASYTHEWKILKLSSLGNGTFSDVFTVGGHKWKLSLFPKGDSNNRGQNLSMYLILVDVEKLTPGEKVNVRFTFRLKSQNNVVHREQKACTAWLSRPAAILGWPAFMPLKAVSECLEDDSCVIEAEVTVLGTVCKLP